MAEPSWQNTLYFGDNLDILRRHMADESVDLIYLDPPFNSNATYILVAKSFYRPPLTLALSPRWGERG